ncbi:MAG TPA: endonuclease/exonuclease/phosphatase family protein [Pseudobdellovibrionaceae bacterium]|jgi:endonuclease/exonuclease/phosphatase family metal-dependent hydrolase
MKILLASLVLIFQSYQVFAYSIGTYNLHNMSDLEGLKRDLKNLNHISIFAFQEVRFRDSDQDNLLLHGILPVGKYPYVVTQKVAKDDDGNIEGHAIVSKYPILKSMVIPLEHTDKKNREALVAWIQIEGREIMVINTDHEVHYKDISYLDRRKQILSLITALDKINFKGTQILLGDFNTSDSIANWGSGVTGEKEVKLTYDFFKDRGWQPTYASSEKDYTFQSWGFTQHLDHILFKNSGTDKIKPWLRFNERKGSDHYPIYSFFE